jgi:Icc-related predicted phosphoesterase
MGNLRVFFATDIHGSEKCFMKFVNSAKHYGVDQLILGGDVCGKVMVPVVKSNGDRYSAQHLGERVEVEGESALADLLKNIRFSGCYPYLTDDDGLAEIQADPERREQVFTDLVGETLERWVRVAEERLGGSGVRVFMMLGNDDEPEMAERLEGSDVVQHAEGRVCDLGEGVSMVSVGYSNRTPWNSPRELDEEDLYARIESAAAMVDDPSRSVFNLHCPPIASGLDEAPQLDDELRPVATLAAGGVATGPAGSEATRRAIEEFQPLVGVHGHIHESSATRKIGRTQCFNPGSEYGSGILRGVVLVLDVKRGVRNYMFTTG